MESQNPGENSRVVHTEKYGDVAILVNERYIDSEEYQAKFIGITNDNLVDLSIYEHAVSILKDRSGSMYETLILLDASDGTELLEIQSNGDDQRIEYTPEQEGIIKDLLAGGHEIIAIHNHPTGYPPTADDCVSARIRGFKLGITCGHNGTVYLYYPSEVEFSTEECEEIHDIISIDCQYETSIDKVLEIWTETLKDLGMQIKERR